MHTGRHTGYAGAHFARTRTCMHTNTRTCIHTRTRTLTLTRMHAHAHTTPLPPPTTTMTHTHAHSALAPSRHRRGRRAGGGGTAPPPPWTPCAAFRAWPRWMHGRGFRCAGGPPELEEGGNNNHSVHTLTNGGTLRHTFATRHGGRPGSARTTRRCDLPLRSMRRTLRPLCATLGASKTAHCPA